MSAAAAQPKPQSSAPMVPVRSLRVGIILGGNIIEERLVRSRETITIGQSSKNTFSVPVESLPKAWALFTIEGGQYVLHFTDGMDGRISDGRGVHMLAQLKSHGAQRVGDHWAVKLVESSRGKIVLGEMTLLFQFVNAPPLQPRPRLPASVRGSLADRIDPQLAVILAISVLLHFGLALFAWMHDQTVQSRVDRIHRQFQEDSFKERTIAKTFEVATTGTKTEVAQPVEDKGKTEDKGSKTPDKASKTPDDGGGASPDDASIQETINSSALVAAITGDEASGGRYGKMGETDQGADLNKALDNAKGHDTSTMGNGDGDRHHRGEGTGNIAGEKGHGKVGGPGEGTQIAGKGEEKVSRVKVGEIQDLGGTTLDPDVVFRTIQTRYIEGVKRCHQMILKQDPNAGGRVTVKFTVGPTGGVTRESVQGFDPGVDACIKGLVAKWRFGAPKDDAGKPTSADFQFPFVLKPGN